MNKRVVLYYVEGLDWEVHPPEVRSMEVEQTDNGYAFRGEHRYGMSHILGNKATLRSAGLFLERLEALEYAMERLTEQRNRLLERKEWIEKALKELAR